MTQLLTVHADDPGLPAAVARMLTGGPPLAPLPSDPGARTAALAMLRPEQPVVEDDAGLIVATSGSTGEPKGVVLSRAAIHAGVTATHARLGGPGNWTLALPAHYVAGVLVIARAVAAGTDLFPCTGDLHDLPDPATLTQAASPRNYLSLVPTQLVRALTQPDVLARLAAYDAILLGGAAADPAILARAASAGLRVVTTYGMSETSGGCVYDGVPLDGVDISLDDAGRVSISGPVVFSGYRLRPDLTAEVLVEPVGSPAAADAATPHPYASPAPAGSAPSRTLFTRDRARWVPLAEEASAPAARCGGPGQPGHPDQPARRLEVLGRIDDVVISGGVNVDLAAVEKALHTIDPHGAAIGVPDPEWGTRIVAALTNDLPLAALRDRLHTLEPAARPRGLLRHPHLPTTASGKIDRQELIAWWESGPAEREEL